MVEIIIFLLIVGSGISGIPFMMMMMLLDHP